MVPHLRHSVTRSVVSLCGPRVPKDQPGSAPSRPAPSVRRTTLQTVSHQTNHQPRPGQAHLAGARRVCDGARVDARGRAVQRPPANRVTRDRILPAQLQRPARRRSPSGSLRLRDQVRRYRLDPGDRAGPGRAPHPLGDARWALRARRSIADRFRRRAAQERRRVAPVPAARYAIHALGPITDDSHAAALALVDALVAIATSGRASRSACNERASERAVRSPTRFSYGSP